MHHNTYFYFLALTFQPWVPAGPSGWKNLTKKIDKGVIQSNNLTMNPPKEAIITFKVDAALAIAMKGVANRSEFIRSALLAALDSVCPLCSGSGVLTPNQMRHWQEFAASHVFEECRDCHEIRLVCAKQRDRKMWSTKATRRAERKL
jgi:hypothetical protein